MSFESLSPSLLRKIFLFALDDTPITLPPGPCANGGTSNLVLTQVSRRWRTMLLHDPSFWTHFKFLPQPVRRPDHLRAVTTAWLKRGQDSDLHLEFPITADEELDDSEGRPTHAYQLLYAHGGLDVVKSIFLQFGGRIRTLKGTICTERVIKSFLKIPSGTFQRLQLLDITFLDEFSGRNTSFTADELKQFTVFQGLTNLQHVAIKINNGIRPLSLHLPSNTLVILDLGKALITPHAFMALIRQSSHSLRVGYFQIIFDLHSKYSNAKPILEACGQRVETLHLWLRKPGNDKRIFSRLTLPSLRELRIHLYDPHRGWKPSILTKMLQISSPPLKFLKLSDFSPDPSSFFTPVSAGRQRRVHHSELEALFLAARNLRCLILPFKLFIHAVTLEKIANGELLPYLEFLAATSTDGRRVLSAAQRRNELAIYSLSRPGNSLIGGIENIPSSPITLARLIMAVPKEDRAELEDVIRKLQTDTRLVNTDITIVADDMENFKL